ncbi:MAG: metal-sensitive transcriptional regulator [Firmicutes bacterium]|nr:metal-sensitive transcriptional regulator [Bacillota bacterium]
MDKDIQTSTAIDQAHTDVSPGYARSKVALLNRMRRIEGQTRGIEKMIEENKYCIDILNQIAAVRTALDRVAVSVVDEHISHCVREAIDSKDKQDADIKQQELMEVIDRFMKII